MTARTHLVRAGLAGCLVVGGSGIALGLVLQTGHWYPYKAAGIFAALIAVMLRFIGGHPFNHLGPANSVTVGRAMLVALAAALVGEPDTSALAWAAVAAAAASVLLDGADGWLARRSGMASTFGGRFVVETDALFIMVLSVLVWQHHKAGAWVLACGLLRYAFVAGGWLLPWLAGSLAPTPRGRAVAVAQVVGLGAALTPAIASPESDLIALATLSALTWSFALDVRRLWRRQSTD
jgi:phosphatidylglycerophosphate synthase